jgi:hypothetical protein
VMWKQLNTVNVIVIVQADFQVLQYVEHVRTIVRQYIQYKLDIYKFLNV